MTRCWVLEKGGDRCVLVTDHPGPHMGGYHTFTSIPGTEEMARLIGSHCDQLENALRDKIADLIAECGRLRADNAQLSATAHNLRLDIDNLSRGVAEEYALLRAERDGLLAAAKAAASSLMAVAQWTDDDGDMMSLRAYARNRAAVALAACAPEVKP